LKHFVERELGHEDAEARKSFYGRWHDRLDELAAMDRYWPDLSESVYAMWFYFDFELTAGGRVADLFLERNWQLSSGERHFIQGVRETAMRLYEVENLSPGISVTLKEVLSETRVTVHERLGSRSMSRHSLIAARVTDRGASGMPEIEAGLLSIPELVREMVVSQLSAHREHYRLEYPDSSDTEFFKEMAPFFHESWMSCLLDPPVPHLTNADGEDVLITRIRFDVADPPALEVALDSASELEREQEQRTWSWLGANSKGQPTTVLGSIVMEGESLELECMSARRGERGRALIEQLGAGIVRHRSTAHENVTMRVRDELRASGAQKKRAAQTREDLRREVQEALVLDHMARHYRQWLDEPVPALDGRTPRDAVGDAQLRPKPIGLIGQLEGMYHRALQAGDPAYDPSWMWTELGLQSGESPAHPPPLAHERMTVMTPGLAGLCQAVAEQMRARSGFDHKSTLLTAEEIRTNLEIQRFVREDERASDRKVLPPNAAGRLATQIRFMTNFELHRRKIFWVDESLAYMLAKTDLDVPGGDVRGPFPCFALVFTDRQTLSLTERMCAVDRSCPLAGHFLRVVTVYITEERMGETRILTAALALDALGADAPHLFVHDVPLAEHTPVARFLENLAPPVVADPPVRDAHSLRGLLHIILKAILYAVSAGVEPELRRKPHERETFRPPGPPPHVFSSENVYFLPGKIDISRVRHFQELERVETGRRILHRFMVRGHWRRAAAKWTDQSTRWIEPYWKGPDIATVVERAYRLKP
jgi:hypothetical protein